MGLGPCIGVFGVRAVPWEVQMPPVLCTVASPWVPKAGFPGGSLVSEGGVA